jgi:valyl-tRNA synthetase
VRNGDLKIVPADHEKTWFQWLDNIRDWCVSRQLWWGHQIPAWFALKKGEVGVSKNDMEHNDRWIVARDEEAAYEKAENFLGCGRDEIILDFSPFQFSGGPTRLMI